MAQDQRRDRIGKRDTADDFGSDLRMPLNFLEFFLCQRPWFRQDVFGDRELADVVQERRCLETLDFHVRHPERRRNLDGIDLHTPDVPLADFVLGVDGQGECFDRREMEIRDLLHPLLLFGAALNQECVRAVGEEEWRSRQRRPSRTRRMLRSISLGEAHGEGGRRGEARSRTVGWLVAPS